jgi:hypothetical protein
MLKEGTNNKIRMLRYTLLIILFIFSRLICFSQLSVDYEFVNSALEVFRKEFKVDTFQIEFETTPFHDDEKKSNKYWDHLKGKIDSNSWKEIFANRKNQFTKGNGWDLKKLRFN